jgi:hypothetical protein
MHTWWLGWFTFALTLCLALVLSLRAFHDKAFGKLVAGWLCVAVHPGWWLIGGGDCGISRVFGSALMTAGAIALAIGCDWVRPFGERGPIVRGLLAVACAVVVFTACVGVQLPMSMADPGLQECRERNGAPRP